MPRSVQMSTDVKSVDAITALVGCTPFLEIHYRYEGQARRIYAKYDIMNMTGSVKDRMAGHILRRAYETGQLHPGDAIVEASSGNTGISFAAIITPEYVLDEFRDLGMLDFFQ